MAWFKSYAFFSAGAARHPFRPGRPRNREKRKKADITSPRPRFLVHNTISYLPYTTVCKCYTPYILAYIEGVCYLIQYTLSVLNNIILHFSTFPLLTLKCAFYQLLVVGFKNGQHQSTQIAPNRLNRLYLIFPNFHTFWPISTLS